MMLKNVMWNIFQDTGRVDAYLFYRSCNEEKQEDQSDALIGDAEAGAKK